MTSKTAPDNGTIPGKGMRRRDIYYSAQLVLALLSLKRGAKLNSVDRPNHDRFFRVEKGKGRMRIGDGKIRIVPGDGILVPAGISYSVKNTGKSRLRLFAVETGHSAVLPPRVITIAPIKTSAAAAATEKARKGMIDEGSPVGPTRS